MVATQLYRSDNGNLLPTYFEMYVSDVINGYVLPRVYISLKHSCHVKAVDFIGVIPSAFHIVKRCYWFSLSENFCPLRPRLASHLFLFLKAVHQRFKTLLCINLRQFFQLMYVIIEIIERVVNKFLTFLEEFLEARVFLRAKLYKPSNVQVFRAKLIE